MGKTNSRNTRLLWLLLAMVLAMQVVAIPALAASTKVTFRYWGDKNAVAAMETLAADFEKANPDIDIELLYSSTGLPDNLIVAVAGGQAPDASMSHGKYWAPLIEAIQPLDELIAHSPQLQRRNFIDALWDNNRMLGRQMGLPLRANSRVIFYDMDAFEAKGLSKVPTTWEELATVAARVTERNGDTITKWGLGLTSTSDFKTPVGMFAHRNGWREYNEDFTAQYFAHKDMTDTLEYLSDLVVRRIAANPLMPGVGGRVGQLEAGTSAMAIWGPYNIPAMLERNPNLRVGSFPVPRGPSGKPPYAIIAGESVIMLRTAKDKEATLKWLQYLVYDRNEDYCRMTTGVFPVVKRALSQREWQTPMWGAVLDQYLGASFTGIPVMVDTSLVSTAWEAAVKALFLQQKGVQQIQAEVADLATKALKGFQEQLAKLDAKI